MRQTAFGSELIHDHQQAAGVQGPAELAEQPFVVVANIAIQDHVETRWELLDGEVAGLVIDPVLQGVQCCDLSPDRTDILDVEDDGLETRMSA